MYTRFADNDIVTRQAQELVTSTWTNNVNNLQEHWTSSTQADFTSPTSSGQFFIDVYNGDATVSTSEVQYSVAYGNRYGSGSPDFTRDTGSFGLNAARTTYNQFRQLHYNDDTKYFTFGTHTPDDIYVININRARYKQKLTKGSLNFHLSASSRNTNPGGAEPDQSTWNTVHLTDDSVTNSKGVGTSNLGTYYNIVSGSDGVVLSGTTATTQLGTSASYGNFYPEAGLIILNGDAFSASIGNTGGTTDVMSERNPAHTDNTDNNAQRIKNAISGGAYFIVDSTEEINSQFYFCRVRNDQYNYTNNESFVDANKNIRFESMKLNPKVFITTIGLYNDAYELLAIAKLSQPVAKDFTKEALIRVKLDY
jgi:hypothetical protein